MGGGRIRGIGVASFLVTVALGTVLGAQAPEPPKVTRLPTQGVEVVRVDVVVSEKGRPRPGLKREDFAVFEDGKPQTLVQFAAYGRRWPAGASAPAAPAPIAADEAVDLFPRRHVVLVIDDVHMEFASLARARKALTQFVEEDLEPEDQVALLTTSGSRALAQEFTADRAELEEVLSRLSAQERRAEWAGVPQISEYQAELIEGGDSLALDVAVQETMQQGLFQDAASAEERARAKARAIFAEAVYNSRLTLETLEGLTRALAASPGRKVLFLVSDGFLTGLAARSGSGFDMRRIVDAGNRAGVVIYALDTRGLSAPPPGASASSRTRVLPATFGVVESMQRRSEEATRDAMQALAAGTGGFLVHNANNLRAGLRRMLKDTETYYVLAYEPTNGARDGSFRHIEVRVPGVRDVKVRARAGYFAPDDRRAGGAAGAPERQPSREQERQWGMRTTLNSIAPLTAIPVRLSADFVAVDNGVAQVVVSGHVDATTLPFLHRHDRYQETVETVAVVYDEAGAVAATLQTERVAMDLTAGEHEQVLKAGLPYQKSVALKPGRYQVRLAAREDAEGKPGSAWQWVQIPDLASGRLTLSSLFLLKATEPAAAPAADPGATLVLQNAQALRHFRRDENLYVQLYAYNPTRDASGATNLVSQAEILRDGTLLGTAVPEPMAQGEAQGPPVPHTSRIRLRSFEPGTYELRVAVTDRNANETASRRVGFTVD
jgi:VWFA-related protein